MEVVWLARAFFLVGSEVDELFEARFLLGPAGMADDAGPALLLVVAARVVLATALPFRL